MADKFLEAFAKLDQNSDKSISESDIDQAIIEPSLDPSTAEIVAALKAQFKEIKELHKEGWFSRNDRISLADILVFERILKEHLEDSYSSLGDFEQALNQSKERISNPRLLAQTARAVMKRVREAEGRQHSLYKNMDNPIQCIRPEAIRQGMVGDCYFLALLGSIAASNPQMIVRMIKENDDGGYTVTFPGCPEEPISIEEPTSVELALYARLTEWGTWPAVLEKAYGSFVAELQQKPKLVPAENLTSRDAFSDAFQILCGQDFKYKVLNSLPIKETTNLITEAFREKRAMTAGSKLLKKAYTDDAGIPTRHAFSIIGWDKDHSRITFRNPWGAAMHCEPELAGGAPLDGVRDGIFTLDLLHMLLNFEVIYYEDWAADIRFVDSPESPSGAYVRRLNQKR